MKKHAFIRIDDVTRVTGLTIEGLMEIIDEYGAFAEWKKDVLMLDIMDLFHTIKTIEQLKSGAVHKDDAAFYEYLDKYFAEKKKES